MQWEGGAEWATELPVLQATDGCLKPSGQLPTILGKQCPFFGQASVGRDVNLTRVALGYSADHRFGGDPGRVQFRQQQLQSVLGH